MLKNSIILFPNAPGKLGCSRAVTKGIEVVSSSVFMPESTSGWGYSIRIRLLMPGEEGYLNPEQRGFSTCQLRSRHWIIDLGQQEEHVRGNGVIGKYPLLREGGWRDDSQDMYGRVRQSFQRDGTFVYQSCSGRANRASGGSFRGELIFIPGSIENPKGPDFEVIVERFPLTLPEYVY